DVALAFDTEVKSTVVETESVDLGNGLRGLLCRHLSQFRLIRHCGSGDEGTAEPECRSRCHSQRTLHEFLLHKSLSLFSEGTMSQIDDLSHGKVTGSTQRL